MGFSLVRLRQRGARLLDEVERSGTRRVQTARAWPRAAQQKILKKNFAKAPSHEKHFASLDVRGLWHARPLPTPPPLTSQGLRPRN